MDWWKSLIRKYRTFTHLSGEERSILIQALCLLPAVTVMLNGWGMSATQTLLSRLPQQQRLDRDKFEGRVWATVRMVAAAARYYQPWANCLKQSLVLWLLLKRQGIDSNLRIGVQKSAAQFSAHAWVERHGIVLNDSDDVSNRYPAFERHFERY